jgi:hypothetical protein
MRHHDFEIVVSDNSSPNHQVSNKVLVERHNMGERLRYVVPPEEYNMVRHWEFAVDQAKGKFVGFVTDRMTMTANALGLIEEVIAKTGATCVSHQTTKLHKLRRDLVKSRIDGSNDFRICDQKSELLNFSNAILGKDNPRFLNSFIAVEELARIRSKYGAVFAGISPDYNAMFKSLVVCRKIAHMRVPIKIIHSVAASQGVSLSTFANNQHTSDFLARLDHEQRAFAAIGPIPGEVHLLANSILREYELVRIASQNNAMPPVNPKNFARVCLTQLASSPNKDNVAWTQSRDRLFGYMKEHSLAIPQVLQEKADASLHKRMKERLKALTGLTEKMTDAYSLDEMVTILKQFDDRH